MGVRAAALATALLVPALVACGGERPLPDDTLAAAPPGGGVNASVEPVLDTAEQGEPPAPAQSPTVARPAVPIAGSDTAFGTVRRIGTAGDARIVVQTTTGPVAVAGPLTETIGRLEGMDVWVRGPLSLAVGRVIPPRQMTVEAFTVRAVNGVRVLDGTLRAEGDTLLLVAADGARTRLTSAPAELRALAGRRVWITRAADGAVASFGAIGR